MYDNTDSTKIRDKKRTARQIADMVRPGDWINHGTVGGDSTVCTEAVASGWGRTRRP